MIGGDIEVARKHERFSYSYGWRTAPEQWRFALNGKQIQLDSNTRSQLAQLILQGNEIEAEAILKRLLRKQEKEESMICIGFFAENSNTYYFTQDLKCRRNDLQNKLFAYKKWKQYILDNDCYLSAYTLTSGHIIPGETCKKYENQILEKIDLSRPIIIRLVKEPCDKMF